MSVQIGQVIGDYEVIGAIGAGGMGSVFKVKNLISDRVDAMKVLLADLRASPDLADRFLNEIKVLASLAHPNIAALHTALRVDNQLLMIMEYVEGASLDDWLDRGPIPRAQGIGFIAQVLSALAYAHRQQVIHRDIKPANIAINTEGAVKLLDFGLARGQADRRRTRTGMVLGSLFYMSPEQVNGLPADARSDLYSVGVTLYRTVVGRPPVDGDSDFAVMRGHVSETPAAPHEIDPSIPLELSNVIMRSLAKKPADRFQDAAEFRRALEPFLPAGGSSGVRGATRTREAATRTIATPVPQAIPSSEVFHSSALTMLQTLLSEHIGPIAGALVRKQSRLAADLPELCRALGQHIAAGPGRQSFLQACARNLGIDSLAQPKPGVTQGAAVADASLAPLAWEPGLLERCNRQLAEYIGPLAKIMVDRASKKARNLEELYAILAAGIPSTKEREKFLASRPPASS